MGRKVRLPQETQADITWLAKEWERLLAAIEYPTRKFAVFCLLSLCETYLRGRGLRLGSYQALNKSLPALDLLTLAVTKRVVADDARDIWFPTLARLGFSSIEEAAVVMKASLESSG